MRKFGKPKLTYTAILVAPDNSRQEISVVASNKAEARKKIGDVYREDVPRNAKAHGLYSFSDHHLEWINPEA